MARTAKQDRWQWWTLWSMPVWAALTLLGAAQRQGSVLAGGPSVRWLEPLWLESLHWSAFQWVPWAVLCSPIFFLFCTWPWTRGAGFGRLVFYAASGVGFVGLHTALQALAKVVGWGGAQEYASFRATFEMLFFAKAHIEFLVFALIGGVVHAVRFRIEEERTREQKARLEREIVERELEGLRRQLEPHFLFNALSSLSALLEENSPAHRMALQLGEYLRLVLDGQQGTEIRLRQELDLVKAYVAIESIRFGPRLAVTWTVDDEVLDRHVPTLLLQPLVENAVRHGVASTPGITRVEIEAAKLASGMRLAVTNRCEAPPVPRGEGRNAAGFGLENVRSRLQAHYDGRASLCAGVFEERGFRVSIELPEEAGPR